MFTEPKIDTRAPLPYVGIRSRVSMGEFGPQIPDALDRTMAWLDAQGIQPDGPPLIRYHACPTECGPEAFVEVCVGWPLAKPVAAPEGFEADSLPAGRYASLVFTGVENGMAGNGALIDWARAQGLSWDAWPLAGGEGFAGRVEHLIDGPEDDPDPANWRNEVAIKLDR